MKWKTCILFFLAGLFAPALQAQRIGLLTTSPQAPVHVSSAGLGNTAGGLMVLGDTTQSHLELDFDILQARNGAAPLAMKLQPYGGNLGINTLSPKGPFHVYSGGTMNTPGGLAILGNTSQGHLEMDYDILQSSSGAAAYLPLNIQPAGGNLNVGSGLLFADRTNGFVGINTTNPTTELQLHGEMRMTTSGFGTAQKDKLAIYGELENVSTVGLGWLKVAPPEGSAQDNSPASRVMMDLYEMYYKSQGAHRWFTNELADVNGPNMVLTADGDLGIGPASPNGKLHLTNGYSTSLTDKGYIQLGLTTTTNLVMDNNEIQARANNNGSTLFLNYWGGNTSICNSDGGKVGIGLITPVSKLQIGTGEDASLNTHGYLMTGLTNGPNVVMDNNEIMARNNGAAASFYVQHDDGNVLMCGQGSGQVGIGITSDATLPSAEYLLAVDGKILSEEVRVELSEDWPDYVFKEDYNLRPLDELRVEIQARGHLPGIPSAKEVEAEGFELGDMQRRLLEKVEELTLYILDLHETHQQLKNEIEMLKKGQMGE